MSKIQFESNSQPSCVSINSPQCCVQYVKDTIRKQFTTISKSMKYIIKLCSICQRYNSKAIHNFRLLQVRLELVVFNMSKIQFESNSQPVNADEAIAKSCVQYVKDTIRKQFTTFLVISYLHISLCSICQRYNSKAIHNSSN